MAIHWTEYPGRVETFADLLSVLDTLDRHEMESGFTAENFQNERGRATAYTVEFHNQQHQFRPRLDQMPGLARLLDHFDIDGYPALTHSQARELRRLAAKALNRDGASLNAMTFTQIADALEGAQRGHIPNPRVVASPKHDIEPSKGTSAVTWAALDDASRLTRDALRAARGLALTRSQQDNPNWVPSHRELCDRAAEKIAAAREAVKPLVMNFRALMTYKSDRPFCGKFWASAHEAAVEAANDLLWRFRPECGDPGAPHEDTVYAALEGEVEREHAAVVGRLSSPLVAQTHSAAIQRAPQPAETIVTFGDLLLSVQSVEQAVASARATADAMNDSPGAGYWRIQAGVYEATAEYKNHPSFPHLEAHVNSKYGSFTYANLLRVRGEVCASRNCGSMEADQLTVEEVTTVLNCPGAPTVNQPNAKRVQTRPDAVEPPGPFVEAAMRALPGVLNNAPQPQGIFDPAGRRGANYAILRQRLESASHSRDAAEWAIHRHVEAGHLEAAPGLTSTPGVLNGGEWAMRPVTNQTYDRERCVLWANPALWDWWRSAEGAPTVTNMESPVAPARENAAPSALDSYTMRDIRDLLRYQREYARYEDWARGTFKPVMSVGEYASRMQVLAFNAPDSGRLSAEVAHTLAVYRRLLKASVDVLKRELDEQALLFFVGEVVDRHKLKLEDVLLMSTDDFLRLMDQNPEAKSSGAPHVAAATNDLAQATGKGAENEGGRPTLGEGPNATRQEKARRNVYELVRAVYKQRFGPAKLHRHFRDNKDFKDRVAEAGETFDEQLFRAAIAWIKENPDQKTQSGNVS